MKNRTADSRLHLARGGPSRLGADLAEVARTADAAGFDRIAVMDHVFQIGASARPSTTMLEAYTTLGFLAANTSRARSCSRW